MVRIPIAKVRNRGELGLLISLLASDRAADLETVFVPYGIGTGIPDAQTRSHATDYNALLATLDAQDLFVPRRKTCGTRTPRRHERAVSPVTAAHSIHGISETTGCAPTLPYEPSLIAADKRARKYP